VESINGVARVALSGELDMASAPILQEQLTLSEQGDVTTILLDLRELSFLDSKGLHEFAQAKERADADGRQLILVGASASSRRLFDLTQTRFLLDDEDAVDVMGRLTTGSDG
jgi:anti-sigma B factor antagonist